LGAESLFGFGAAGFAIFGFDFAALAGLARRAAFGTAFLRGAARPAVLRVLRLVGRATFLRRLAAVAVLRDLLAGERFGAFLETLGAFLLLLFLLLFLFGMARSPAEMTCGLAPERKQNPSRLASHFASRSQLTL
jgi:hypothetical protein